MASAFSIVVLLFGASFIISIEGLVCYDNIFNNDSVVLIGCDFNGAACATTTKTTRTSYFGLNETTTKVYYHCAKRTTSCITGPLHHCTSDKNVECDTQCCDSNKCNSPQNGTSVDIPEVPAARATECYQLVGRRSERVKCLFKNAKCLYIELKPKPDPTRYTWMDSTYQDAKLNGSQYCASQTRCHHIEQTCDFLDSLAWATGEACSMKCCSTRRCNSLSSNEHYIEQEPKIDPQKIRHSWIGPKNYLATVSPRTTTVRTWNVDVDDYEYDYQYSNRGSLAWSNEGMPIWLIIVIFVVIVITISAVVGCNKACGENKRPAMRTTAMRNNAYIPGYGDEDDSQTV